VPSEYTIEQTAKLYELMYDLGCKGGTIYRDGSRDEQILATKMGDLGKDVAEAVAEGKLKFGDAITAESTVETHTVSQTGKIMPRVRPAVMMGMTYRVRTPYGNLFVTINEDEQGPFEVFAQLGKSGGFFGGQTEAICRMVSVALRSGIEIQEVIDQLKGIRGPEVSFDGGEMIFSLPDAIAKILERHLKNGRKFLTNGEEINIAESPINTIIPYIVFAFISSVIILFSFHFDLNSWAFSTPLHIYHKILFCIQKYKTHKFFHEIKSCLLTHHTSSFRI
jgi:ribonucleoside-diphosphate reductase alpha chain